MVVNRQLLPYELIVQSYRLLFPSSFFEPGAILEKSVDLWIDIEGLTLASKETRGIILSLWFHILRISDCEDWKEIPQSWPRLYQWTRGIHYTSTAYKTPRRFLESFTRLNSLRIDLPTIHVIGEGDFDFSAPQLAEIIEDAIPVNATHHLEIRGITWLDPFVMSHIAEGVPNLRTLRFKQPLVWCGLCNTIGTPSFKVIPGRRVYGDGSGLPDGYSRFLAPLEYLHTVTLTVGCTRGDIPYDSLFSDGVPKQTPDLPICIPTTSEHPTSMTSTSNPPNSSSRRHVGWSGECGDCMHQLLDDETFRTAWVAKREKAQTSAEDEVPLRTNRPPSLRRVEWELLELSNDNWPGLLPTSYHTTYSM